MLQTSAELNLSELTAGKVIAAFSLPSCESYDSKSIVNSKTLTDVVVLRAPEMYYNAHYVRHTCGKVIALAEQPDDVIADTGAPIGAKGVATRINSGLLFWVSIFTKSFVFHRSVTLNLTQGMTLHPFKK